MKQGWRLRLTQAPGRTLLLVACLLMLPVFLHPQLPLPRKVYAVGFVIDITQSMNVRDGGPGGIARLAFARQSVRDTLRHLPCGSLVSIGMFTERDVSMLFKPMEVCAHFSVLDEAVERLDWRMAWAADSFITHGLYRGIEETRKLKLDTLVFITDGQQAPPANPRYMPVFDGKPGEVGGIIAGVGGRQRQAIPKLDENDNITGYWVPEDAMQFATFGMAAVQSVQEMEGYHGRNAPHGAHPEGSYTEHMSALDEPGLQELARITGLQYLHLQDNGQLADALRQNTQHRQWVASDIRPLFAGLALLLLLASYFPAFISSLFKKGKP